MSIVNDMPEAEYHAHPALSSTEARQLLRSPAKYQYRLTRPQEPRTEFDLGSAVHAKVLGVGWGIVELDFPDFRTKAAQEARDAARESGLIPMLRKDMTIVHNMAEGVLRNREARRLLEVPSAREVSAFATVDGVDARARLDILTEPSEHGVLAIDLKTTAKDADPDTFARSVIDYGYDAQEAWYTDVLAACGTTVDAFLFITVEKEPPYLTAVHQLDVVFREMGKVKAQRAREIYADCTATGTWPGHPDDVQICAPPAWAAYAHEEKYGPFEGAEIRI